MINQLFFELIQVSLGVRACLSRTPLESEWEALFRMAQKQSLVGICFAGLKALCTGSNGYNQIGLPKPLYMTWVGRATRIQQKNETVAKQCAVLQERLLNDGFRSCILKGEGVSRMYGERLSSLRQSGDIDVWIDASREKVIEYCMGLKATKEFDQKHIQCPVFDNIPVEAHWIPVKHGNPFWNRKMKRYFDSERERQFTNIEDGLCVPTADFQLVHQLFHVYGHFMYEGVGMRQVMDLYFAQKACPKPESQKVLALFKSLGLERFVAATQWVLAKVFMMPEEEFLCTADEGEGKVLLVEILLGGNFGKFDKRNRKKDETFFQRIVRRWGRKFRMIRFDPWGTILMPFVRLRLEFWIRKVRRQYDI